MTSTAYVSHEDYRLHHVEGHPENASRLVHIWDALERHRLVDDFKLLVPRPATPAELARVHDPEHIDMMRWISEKGGGLVDADTYVLPVSYDVALLAAGGVLTATEAVLKGAARNALAVVRPPGHHATATRAMGFCLFNNIAAGVRHAQAIDPRIGRVMIVDFDVHHGNGTQDIFYEDPSVLFVSTHQYPFYPGSGAASEIGIMKGRGTTINMPLRAGTGNKGYTQLYEQVLWPAARRYRPDMIFVSAGFDAHWCDPLAMINLDLKGYAHLSRELIRMADELCEGRIVFVLEGGYDLRAVAHGVSNAGYALLGKDDMLDPIGDYNGPQASTDDLTTELLRLHQL